MSKIAWSPETGWDKTSPVIPPYFATKYSSMQDEFLHDISSYWTTETSGDSDCPTGWFGALDFTKEDLLDLRRTALVEDALANWLRQILTRLDEYAPTTEPARREYYNEIVGWFLLSGNDQGFCYVQRFPDEQSRDDAFDILNSQYLEWAEVEDDFDTMNPNT